MSLVFDTPVPHYSIPLTELNYSFPNRIVNMSTGALEGAALYTLGKVPAGYDLFEEIPGPGDDKLIQNDATTIELKNGLHFYTAKQSLNPGNGKQ